MPWLLFCTAEVDGVLLFDEVDNEIDAVVAFRSHAALYGPSHIPHIWMQPGPWPENGSGTEGRFYPRDVLVEPNYFRVPDDMKEVSDA